MQELMKRRNSAKDAYDAYAAAYDDFNRGYMYKRWSGRLLAKAQEAGLKGNRLLDVGCGTGLSFIAMLQRGWNVTACDISPQMLDIARQKVDGRVELHEADMRELAALGEFDLVWSVNDAVNYLLSVDELEAAFTGMGQNLAPEGILLFDVNTLATYRTFFSSEILREENGRQFSWRGNLSAGEVAPGVVAEADFDAAGEPEIAHTHRQRHFPEGEVIAAMKAAGMRSIGVFGEMDGDLYSELDEDRHTKAVYLCQLVK